MDVNQLFKMLDQIPVTEDTEQIINDTRTAIEEGDYQLAIEKINQLYSNSSSSNENEEPEQAQPQQPQQVQQTQYNEPQQPQQPQQTQ